MSTHATTTGRHTDACLTAGRALRHEPADHRLQRNAGPARYRVRARDGGYQPALGLVCHPCTRPIPRGDTRTAI